MSTRLNSCIAAATGTLLVTVMATGAPAQPESRDGTTDAAGVEAGEVREANARLLGDIDGDGVVGINDFLILLGEWGPCDQPCPPVCAADLDSDCDVGITDFLLLLANWG